jgi:SWI/SNF-related matrix-associated actin-dependent regulator of chromatin subfamily D
MYTQSLLTRPQVFNVDRLFFPQIPELTLSHIHPLQPITINYTIRTDVASHMSPTFHDVTIYTDDPIRQKMVAILHSQTFSQTLREISTIDDHIAVCVQAIAHSKAKRDFLIAMSEDPAAFVKRWVSSQKADLDTLCGEPPGRGVEENDVRSAIWKERFIESVYLVLSKRGHQGN